MADFTIKVSTEELTHQANEIKSSVDALRQQFGVIEECVRRAPGYWEGEASKLHTTRFTKLKEDCDNVMRLLGEHPNELLRMAGIYTETEKKSTQEAASLQSNILS